jgi:hypothetical protein
MVPSSEQQRILLQYYLTLVAALRPKWQKAGFVMRDILYNAEVVQQCSLKDIVQKSVISSIKFLTSIEKEKIIEPAAIHPS